MLANILKLAATSAPVGAYLYLREHRVSLTNPYLASLLQLVHTHRPQYALPIFKAILKLNVLAPDPQLQSYTLGGGFDPEGDYIEEVRDLGFAGIEVGPTSFNASLEEEAEQHLGILNALANICTYQARRSAEQRFRLELRIAPNFEIIKYTPYLLRENLLSALDHFLKIQQHYSAPLVHRLTLSFQRAGYSLESHDSQEVQRMISQTKSEAMEKVRAFNGEGRAQVELEFGRRERVEWGRLLDYIINKQSL